MAKLKLTGIVILLYLGVVAVTIVIFTMLVHSMDNSGTTSMMFKSALFTDDQGLPLNPKRVNKAHLIGNVVAHVKKLGITSDNITNKVEWKEPPGHKEFTKTKRKNTEHARKLCHVPKPTSQHPLCGEKVAYIQINWRFPCYVMRNNIRSKDDLCSILIYLSEVEKWCPRLPWRKSLLKTKTFKTNRKMKIRKSLNGLITKWFNEPLYQWMKNRIASMEREWIKAIISLSKKRQLTKRTKKQIVIFFGAFAIQPALLTQSTSGGPLGELVQWSDIVTSFYLLGHDLTIIKNVDDLPRYLPTPDEDGCISDISRQNFEYDLLYTDIAGILYLIHTVGPYWSEIRCKTRIVDSFGTEAEFNYKRFSDTDKKYHSNWGKLDLNLRQFMTMFPHSPDNSFIGFVSGAKQNTSRTRMKNTKENMALVYAKQDSFWIVGNRNYLDKIHEYLEIHGTFNRSLGVLPHYIPDYVINHGVVSRATIDEMLKKSKVFVGLGFPYEGPAPLEAVANGAAFLNPKFTVPLNRHNSAFFKTKPNARLVTSQNPYTEQFIGEPYVYTIDITNATQVARAMRKIMNTELKPYLPYEFTHEGMLERQSVHVEHLDFCKGSQWPPLKNLKTVKGKLEESCKHACWGKGMLCEPAYWDVLNQLIMFRRKKITCDTVKYSDLLVAPSYEKKMKTCHLQRQPLLYSCVSSSSSHMRLCPCRDYIREQVALCKNCW